MWLWHTWHILTCHQHGGQVFSSIFLVFTTISYIFVYSPVATGFFIYMHLFSFMSSSQSLKIDFHFLICVWLLITRTATTVLKFPFRLCLAFSPLNHPFSLQPASLLFDFLVLFSDRVSFLRWKLFSVRKSTFPPAEEHPKHSFSLLVHFHFVLSLQGFFPKVSRLSAVAFSALPA